MAFDPLSETFILEANFDLQGAVLLSGAAAALQHDDPEWWGMYIIPCDAAFRALEYFGDPNGAACESGEAACWFLLFAREELRYI